MSNTAFVTGTDRGLGLALSEALLKLNWVVVAGHLDSEPHDLLVLAQNYPGRLHTVPLDVTDETSVAKAVEITSDGISSLDLLISNAGVLGVDGLHRTITDGLNFYEIGNTVDVNAFGPLRVVQHLLPLMQKSPLKRLCFVSSEAGSIGKSHRDSWFGYCMSKAALNMGISILFNSLKASGFTFRVYHPGWMKTYMSGTKNEDANLEPSAAAGYALDYFINEAVDESRLVMRDFEGTEWPW